MKASTFRRGKSCLQMYTPSTNSSLSACVELWSAENDGFLMLDRWKVCPGER